MENAITARIDCKTEEDGDGATSRWDENLRPGFQNEARIFGEVEAEGSLGGRARQGVAKRPLVTTVGMVAGNDSGRKAKTQVGRRGRKIGGKKKMN